MFMVMDLSKMNFDKTPRFLQKIFKMTKPSKIILNPGYGFIRGKSIDTA